MRIAFVHMVICFVVSIVCRPVNADLVSPDTAVASTQFTAGFDGLAIHTIDGSGLPANFTVSDAHAAYSSGNHWTTTGGPPANEFITWGFITPQTLDSMFIWNHQSTVPPAANPGYDVTQYDLTLLDVSGGVLLTLNDNALLPDTATGQTLDFGTIVTNVGSIRFEIDSVQSSSTFTGLAEVAFNTTAIPEPSSLLLLLLCGTIAAVAKARAPRYHLAQELTERLRIGLGLRQ